jgi:hypothetical protein
MRPTLGATPLRPQRLSWIARICAGIFGATAFVIVTALANFERLPEPVQQLVPAPFTAGANYTRPGAQPAQVIAVSFDERGRPITQTVDVGATHVNPLKDDLAPQIRQETAP